MRKVMIVILIAFFRLWGEEPYPYFKQWVNIVGELQCERETLAVINYGSGKGKINYPTRSGFCSPEAFDVDEKESIYILEEPWIYKINEKKQLQKKDIGSGNLDFKYYNKRLFFYKKNKIVILNADNFELTKEILLPDTMNNRRGISGVSFFDGHYLFIQDFNFKEFKKKLEYIYDLKKGVFSNKIIDDSLFSPITKCNIVELTFLKELTHSGGPISFMGQTDKFLCFNFICSQDYWPDKCKSETEQYYILDKKNKNAWMILFEGKPDIDFTASRPIFFVNDSTVIYQSLIGNYDGEYRDGSQDKLIYYKMHINMSSIKHSAN